jgi:hypothetical protein
MLSYLGVAPISILNQKAYPAKSQNSCTKLSVYDWLHDLPHPITEEDLVEVRFKKHSKSLLPKYHAINLRQVIWWPLRHRLVMISGWFR